MRSTRANSYLVVRRSPVAIGIDVACATRAISSGMSGGVGSSNQSGSYFSRRLAIRIAPLVVNCPCVPNSMSTPGPTASRICLTNRSQRSSASTDGLRGSSDE